MVIKIVETSMYIPGYTYNVVYVVIVSVVVVVVVA